MPSFLPLLEKLIFFLAFLHLVGPLVVKFTFRFAAKVEPVKISIESLSVAVRAIVERWSPQIEALGFTPVGIYNMGALASNTQSFLAYFVNRSAGEFADVSIVTSSAVTKSYFEFSSSFSNGFSLETNVNKVASISAAHPQIRVFRFPEIASPGQLYQIHRALIQKYAGFLGPQLPPVGEEAARIVQQVGRYGPCQVQAGLMYLASDGSCYRLTWKGAFLMTWKSLWPTSFIRKSLFRAQMQKELKSLQPNGAINVRTA